MDRRPGRLITALRRFVGAAAILASLASPPAAARAQRLVAAPDTSMPFHIDSVTGPIEEAGALVVFGNDVETATPRSMRIDATTITAGPGVDSHVADVVACAGARWIVRFESVGQTSTTTVGQAGAPVVWSRASVTDVVARCVAGQLVVGYNDDGSLVTQLIFPAQGPRYETRVAPRGEYPQIRWVAHAHDEIDVVVWPPNQRSTELLRIVRGAITHRRDLGRSFTVAIAATGDAVLVAAGDPEGRVVTLRRFARADLAPGPTAAVSGREGHGISVNGLFPGPRGLVAVAVSEGWTGLGYILRRRGPGQPLLGQPETHHASLLLLWTPSAGTVGPSIDLGPVDASGLAWLGTSLVLVQPVHSETDVDGDRPPRLLPARVRRFTVARSRARP